MPEFGNAFREYLARVSPVPRKGVEDDFRGAPIGHDEVQPLEGKVRGDDQG